MNRNSKKILGSLSALSIAPIISSCAVANITSTNKENNDNVLEANANVSTSQKVTPVATYVKLKDFGANKYMNIKGIELYNTPYVAINGTYNFDKTKGILNERNSYVQVDGVRLNKNMYKIHNGKISINAEAVHGKLIEIYIDVVLYVNINIHVEKGRQDKIKINIPKNIKPGEPIIGTYKLEDGCEIKPRYTSIKKGSNWITKDVKLKDGEIYIDAKYTQLNEKNLVEPFYINIDLFDVAQDFGDHYTPVFAKGDAYVEFEKPRKCWGILGYGYDISYTLHHGTLKKVSIKNDIHEFKEGEDYVCQNGKIHINADDRPDKMWKWSALPIRIEAKGQPIDYNFTTNFAGNISVVSHNEVNFAYDFKCKIDFPNSKVLTSWGCSVNGDELYSQYLKYDPLTKTFTLPGNHVKGDIKLWASIA